MAIALGPTGTVGATPLVDRPPRLDELLALPAWHADAACREQPAISFFPDQGQGTAAAKRVCARCLVRRECLEYALEHEDGDGEAHGVWGGTTPSQRRDIRAGRLSVDQALDGCPARREASNVTAP